MQRIAITLMLGGALLLAGCASLQQPTCSAPRSITDVAACARQIVLESCAFSVSIDNLLQIIRVGEFTTALSLGGAVCAAVTSGVPSAVPGKRAAGVPLVSGVPVRGTFVKR